MIPRSRGGSDAADNRILACVPCNSSKGARTPLEWFAGVNPRGRRHAVRLNYNVSPGQAQLIAHAAAKVGEPVSLFVRKAALLRAHDVNTTKKAS